MRLKDYEAKAIKNVVKKYDDNARIYLFGSRTIDTEKGGDIDILILSDKIKLNEKIKIKINLYNLIGEQRIDLIAAPELNTSFLKYIFERSIKL